MKNIAAVSSESSGLTLNLRQRGCKALDSLHVCVGGNLVG